jgi:hypothetical protein
MGVKDWPTPVRRALGYGLFAVLTALSFLPAIAIVFHALANNALNQDSQIWVAVLGGYSAVISAPVAIAVAIGALQGAFGGASNSDLREKFLVYPILGAVAGFGAALPLIPLTGGYSLIFAPPASYVVCTLAWFFRRSNRDQAPDPNATPS